MHELYNIFPDLGCFCGVMGAVAYTRAEQNAKLTDYLFAGVTGGAVLVGMGAGCALFHEKKLVSPDNQAMQLYYAIYSESLLN